MLGYIGRCPSYWITYLFPSFYSRKRVYLSRLWIFSAVAGSSSWRQAYYLYSRFLVYRPFELQWTISPPLCCGLWLATKADPSSGQVFLQPAWASFCSCLVSWRACCYCWSAWGGSCPTYWQENSISKCKHRGPEVLTEMDCSAASAPKMTALRRCRQTDCFPYQE